MITHEVDVASIKDSNVITLEQIGSIAAQNNPSYQSLIRTITERFPSSRSSLEPNIQKYWEVCDGLSTSIEIIIMNTCIVVPYSLRRQILNNLHAAHQGHDNMSARANQTVYWSGMNANIRLNLSTCPSCNQITPSQPTKPMIETPKPKWQFQQLCADYFETEEQSYLYDSGLIQLLVVHLSLSNKYQI